MIFDGSGADTITRGADLESDSVASSRDAASYLVASRHHPGATGPATYDALSRQTNVVGVGDRPRQPSAAGFGYHTSFCTPLDGVGQHAVAGRHDVSPPQRDEQLAVHGPGTDAGDLSQLPQEPAP